MKAAAWGDHGDGVVCYFWFCGLCVCVCFGCCVSERWLVSWGPLCECMYVLCAYLSFFTAPYFFMGRRLIYLVLAFSATPGQWQDFIPFQSKGKIRPQNSQFQSFMDWTPKQSIPEQHSLPNSQSMSNTKLNWPLCIPTFCWAKMAICPMRYVSAMLYA